MKKIYFVEEHREETNYYLVEADSREEAEGQVEDGEVEPYRTDGLSNTYSLNTTRITHKVATSLRATGETLR